MLRNKMHFQESKERRVNHPPATLFDQFLKERAYLKNVTPSTLVWYRTAFKNYQAAIGDSVPPLPTKATLQQFVVAMRDRKMRPVTCNTNVAAMNAFCLWLQQEGHTKDRVQLAKLRIERRMLPLLDDAQMRALISYGRARSHRCDSTPPSSSSSTRAYGSRRP
ncbi:MAG TPA: hypothetical protein VKE51_25125 [Vicinamibacterales bacterium]|nr:hypothetical protein [Vicinamibacterales bacterium]